MTALDEIRLVGDRIWVRPDVVADATEQTDSGLFIAPTLASAVSGDDPRPSYISGIVVAMGEGPKCTTCQRSTTSEVGCGDRILFSHLSGQEVVFDAETFVVLKEAEILAVLEEAHA